MREDEGPVRDRVPERPFSLQAEEGSHPARSDEFPPYGIAPDGDTMGSMHIEEALRDLVFPLTREQLLARAGRWRIPVTGASYRTLREYLAPVEQATFRDERDVARAIERAWRTRR